MASTCKKKQQNKTLLSQKKSFNDFINSSISQTSLGEILLGAQHSVKIVHVKIKSTKTFSTLLEKRLIALLPLSKVHARHDFHGDGYCSYINI